MLLSLTDSFHLLLKLRLSFLWLHLLKILFCNVSWNPYVSLLPTSLSHLSAIGGQKTKTLIRDFPGAILLS